MFIAVDKSIVSAEVEVEDSCEVIWTRVTGLRELKLMVGCFYRPPGASVTVLESFKESLLQVVRRYPGHTLLVGGDFNLSSIDWDLCSFIPGGKEKQSCELLLSTFSESCLEQLNRQPTRNGNILDLIATNRPDLFSDVTVE